MMDEFWSEQRDDDSAFQRSSEDADLREWENDPHDPPRTTPTSDSPKSVSA